MIGREKSPLKMTQEEFSKEYGGMSVLVPPPEQKRSLVLFSTQDLEEQRIIKRVFKNQMKLGECTLFSNLDLPSLTGRGRQLYNGAGIASLRACTALLQKEASEKSVKDLMFLNQVKEVFTVSIIPYIEVSKEGEGGVDYRWIQVKNLTTGRSVETRSDGVRVPAPYLQQALAQGCQPVGEGKGSVGSVEVSKVIAEHVKGVAAKNWQASLGVSRYALLENVMARMPLPR